MKKTYVTVDCRISADGTERPLRVIWPDGRSWDVEKVLHKNLQYKNEFEGIRYTVIIGSAEKYIYRNDAGWYVICQN